MLFAAGPWVVPTARSAALANEQATAFVTWLPGREVAGGRHNVFVDDDLQLLGGAALKLQRRVLPLYGIVMPSCCATIMIFAGSWLISEFHWLLYVFGAFLIVTGIKDGLVLSSTTLRPREEPAYPLDPNHYPVTEKLEGGAS